MFFKAFRVNAVSMRRVTARRNRGGVGGTFVFGFNDAPPVTNVTLIDSAIFNSMQVILVSS